MMKGLHHFRTSLKFPIFRTINQISGIHSVTRFHSSITGLHPSQLNLGVITFKLADIGEGIAEVELLDWHVKEGDKVDEMDPICSVQSDKSAVEISTPFTGKIVKLRHQTGDMIKIGEGLTDIDIEGELPPEEEAATHVEQTKPEPNEAGRETPPVKPSQMDQRETISKKETEGKARLVLASPACRQLAAELGVDLSDVTPTGPGGRVTKEDIVQYNESLKAHEARPQPPAHKEVSSETILLKSGIAKAMVKSMNSTLTIPAMSLQEEIDLTEILQYRSEINQYLETTHNEIKKMTLTPFIVKAISLALQRVPIMNSKFDAIQQDRYILYHRHNISIAIASSYGLIVPNIQDVQIKGLLQIQKELKALQTLASEHKLQPYHLQGGTISISNIGIIGGTTVRPLNFDGQGTILGIGRLQILPRYDQETSTFRPRDIVNITATVDHRHVDGATAALFIKLLRDTLENPKLLVL